MTRGRIRPHILGDNHNTEWPRRWVFFDIETNLIPVDYRTTQHTFKLGWACYYHFPAKGNAGQEEWYPIATPEAFWTWVERHAYQKSKLYLCAHNVTYDTVIQDGIRSLVARGWKLKSLITDNALNIWTFRKHTMTIVFIDSLNIFKAPLAEVGAMVGKPKMSIDFATCTDEELSIYCRNDVEILRDVFVFYRRFLLEHDCGNFAPTTAGQAFNSYRHRFMQHKIYILASEDVDEFERQGYYGGRVECFQIGKQSQQNYYMLDVNSLYPYIMSTTNLPMKLLDVDWHPRLDMLREMLDTHFCIAEVTLNTPIPAYPKRHRGRLLFPQGGFTTTLCSPELEHALRQGHIRYIHKLAYYEQGVLFADYVHYWYGERQKYRAEGNITLDYFCKLMLNSLYGKFGQKGGVWNEIGECDRDTIAFSQLVGPNGETGTIRMFGGVIQEMVRENLSYNTFTAIAAGVTSAARMYLWHLIGLAGRDNVYYCDTDSLIVNQQGRNNLAGLVNTVELGKLKMEAQDYELELFGPKDFVFAGAIKRKGIRKTASAITDTVFEQEHWPTLSGLLRRGTISEYQTIKVTKHLSRVYEKGVVLGDGRVIPFYMLNNEIQEVR